MLKCPPPPPPKKKSCPLWDKVKNIIQPDMPQTAIWQMLIACCITKATNTHSEYVILVAFPQQQWLHEHVSMLCYMYTACLLVVCLNSFLLVRWKCVGIWTVMVEFLETSNCDSLPEGSQLTVRMLYANQSVWIHPKEWYGGICCHCGNHHRHHHQNLYNQTRSVYCCLSKLLQLSAQFKWTNYSQRKLTQDQQWWILLGCELLYSKFVSLLLS